MFLFVPNLCQARRGIPLRPILAQGVQQQTAEYRPRVLADEVTTHDPHAEALGLDGPAMCDKRDLQVRPSRFQSHKLLPVATPLEFPVLGKRLPCFREHVSSGLVLSTVAPKVPFLQLLSKLGRIAR